MASQVPEDLIAKLAAETGLSTDEVRRIAESAARFADALKATGAVSEEGVIFRMIKRWICVRGVFWSIVCILLHLI